MSSRAKVLLPIAVTVLAIIATTAVIAVRPKLDTQITPPRLPSVRVVSADPQPVRLRVEAQGSVVPRTESDLVAEVSGRITWVSPSLASGGFLQHDEVLVRIDAGDYEVAVERAEAAVQRAKSELELSRANLVRRKNLTERGVASAADLENARNNAGVAAASLRDATAALSQANRDLARTQVVSPYVGRVREKYVDIGQFVTVGSPVARVYAVDYAEVRLPIPDTEAAYVDLPIDYRGEEQSGQGPPVLLRARFAGRDYEWQGRIVRTEGELDARTRMIHAVARVEDPYARSDDPDRPPLSVGLFVTAEIEGRAVDGVVTLPREALRRDGQVLVVDDEDRLVMRPVEVLKQDRETVLIAAGLQSGERVCTSPPALAVAGMVVRPIDVTPESRNEPRSAP
jgi:RND family efflux transporter MFP subunit